MKPKPVVGILAFQGDFAKHQEAFARLRCTVLLIKSPLQLAELDYLVIPGGESSVIDRFIHSQQIAEPIKEFARGHPVWGTCAGMILLATKIQNDPLLRPLGLLDITVDRNGYGRQLDSFVDDGDFTVHGKSEKLEMVFIRAPKVVAVGKDVEVLAECRNEITAVKKGKTIATAFHPELTASLRFQEYFLSLI
jgi:5'-phosphate synthase pdxT subunit